MIYHYIEGLPKVSVSLYHAGYETSILAVVDSGSMVSVLPYDVGLKLGLIWEQQRIPVQLGGVCRGVPAFGVLLRAELAELPPVVLAFAWTRKTSHEVRPLLGYTNFFQQFTVTLKAYNNTFEITPKQPLT